MTTTTTDRIEKEILLRAPKARVWRALTNAKEFGAWFQCILESAFQPGAPSRGRITFPGHEHLAIEVLVEKMEPERLFSFRWHTAPQKSPADFSSKPTTLVEFILEDAPEGTRLRLVETGFDSLPIDDRAKTLKDHEAGWTIQVKAIETYLQQNP